MPLQFKPIPIDLQEQLHNVFATETCLKMYKLSYHSRFTPVVTPLYFDILDTRGSNCKISTGTFHKISDGCKWRAGTAGPTMKGGLVFLCISVNIMPFNLELFLAAVIVYGWL